MHLSECGILCGSCPHRQMICSDWQSFGALSQSLRARRWARYAKLRRCEDTMQGFNARTQCQAARRQGKRRMQGCKEASCPGSIKPVGLANFRPLGGPWRILWSLCRALGSFGGSRSSLVDLRHSAHSVGPVLHSGEDARMQFEDAIQGSNAGTRCKNE